MEEVRVVKLRRSVGEDFGFAIRGGFEHKIGFFVSHVRPGSRAEICGLKVGDQILRVGGYCVERCVIDDFIHLLSFKETVILRVINGQRLPVKNCLEDRLIWNEVRSWSPECLRYADHLALPRKQSDSFPPEPEFPPPTISTINTPQPTPRNSLIQKRNSLMIEEVAGSDFNTVEPAENESEKNVGPIETANNLPIASVGDSCKALVPATKYPCDTMKSAKADLNPEAVVLARHKVQMELSEKLKKQRDKADQVSFNELEFDSFDGKPNHGDSKNYHMNGFSKTFDNTTSKAQRNEKPIINQISTDEGYHEPSLSKNEAEELEQQESKRFPSLSAISVALDEMYSTLDPRLMFTESQLRGRTVEVVTVAKVDLPELLIMREGNPFIRCEGTYFSSEILMMEGRSLAGYSFGEICDMIDSLPKKLITLVIASDDV